MNIINKITELSYIQWVEKFVSDVITHAALSPKQVIIEDFEFSRNIFLTIDNEEYIVFVLGISNLSEQIKTEKLVLNWLDIVYINSFKMKMVVMEKKFITVKKKLNGRIKEDF